MASKPSNLPNNVFLSAVTDAHTQFLPASAATAACEAVPRDEIAYNDAHACLPSETAIARRLLAHRTTLAAVYDQVVRQVEQHPRP